MVQRAILILRNILILIVALAIGITTLEMTVNVPQSIKILLVASMILIYARNYVALEVCKFISYWLSKKLIINECSYMTTLTSRQVNKNVGFLGLVLCRGSTLLSNIIQKQGVSVIKTNYSSFWQISACKVINKSGKVNTFRKYILKG